MIFILVFKWRGKLKFAVYLLSARNTIRCLTIPVIFAPPKNSLFMQGNQGLESLNLVQGHTVVNSYLKEINPDYSLEGPMLMLQYFGHLMPRPDSLENTLMLGKIEGMRRSRLQRMRWLDGMKHQYEQS